MYMAISESAQSSLMTKSELEDHNWSQMHTLFTQEPWPEHSPGPGVQPDTLFAMLATGSNKRRKKIQKQSLDNYLRNARKDTDNYLRNARKDTEIKSL
jgi:hypothetical protein